MQRINLHLEQPEQFKIMEELVRSAFWDKYSPGCCEHLVVHNLRMSQDGIRDLCFVAEIDNKPVGGIWYANASIHQNNGEKISVLTMGPVAVHPDFQRQGIGAKLIRHTLQLGQNRACAIIIYGNPAYYSRFGFKSGSEFGITDINGEFCPAILVYSTGNVPSGAFNEGPIYQISPDDVQAFDSTFPPREKHLNSKQIFFSPPCQPPKDPILKTSWKLRNQACTILKASGIIEALEAMETCIRCPNCFRHDSIMTNKSIDLDVHTKISDISLILNTMNSIKSNPLVQSLTHNLKSNNKERYMEWCIKINDNDNNLWSINIRQLLADN